MELTSRDRKLGALYALCAFGFWGGVPIYFKAVGPAGPFEIVSHRILWSIPFTALLITVMGAWSGVGKDLRTKGVLKTLFLSAVLVATNWLIFIYAVNNGQVLASSLGYFINPLVNVLLGMIFLKERLRPRQTVAVLLAAAGTITLTVGYGSLPWISLVLPLTFGTYGLLRKTVKIDSLGGLFVETSLLGPLAAAYLIYIGWQGSISFWAAGPKLTILLALAGVVTSVPLLFFTAGARRLHLATLGLIQYLTPTIHFLLAVAVYGEPFTRTHIVTFGLIWLGLFIFMLDSFSVQRKGRPV